MPDSKLKGPYYWGIHPSSNLAFDHIPRRRISLARLANQLFPPAVESALGRQRRRVEWFPISSLLQVLDENLVVGEGRGKCPHGGARFACTGDIE